MPHLRLLTRASVTALVTVALSACNNMLTPLGVEKYDCNRKQDPTSPFCHSFRSVESGTTGPIPDSRYDQVMRMSDYDRMTGIAPVQSDSTVTVPAGVSAGSSSVAPTATRAVPLVQSGKPPSDAPLETPVRVGPLVQRVWVKRFVDGNDMLISDTRIYKEVVPAHWSGFSAVPASSSSTPPSRSSAYPHRPVDRPAVVSAAKPQREGGLPSTPDFVQPGGRAEPTEMVNPPAIPNGETSLPQ